jgi:hypothetical protein
MTAVLGGRDGWNSDYFAVCLDTPRLCGSRLRFVREPSTETSVRFSWITARKPSLPLSQSASSEAWSVGQRRLLIASRAIGKRCL